MNRTTAAVVVAVAVLVIIGAAGIIAIVRYPVAEALQIWAAVGTLFGAILGSMGTYFFTRQTIDQAEKRAAQAEAMVQTLRSR